MKFLKAFLAVLSLFIISLFSSKNVLADVGCRTGNNIYTQQVGSYPEGSSTIPVFSDASAIRIRNGASDPNCGILRSVSNNYTIVAGTTANPSSKCSYASNPGDQGRLVNYNPAHNSCVLPLDDYVPALILASFFCIPLMRKHYLNKMFAF
ncbi:hypothetical protein [Pedobacter rhizosphaerae]|uniref:Uncharacterized protein n=1 Tax=Pedobacter rhizosphaerae TaxID=390241 RepID=A0A1H9N8R5_9SPHI|nr:hypothetical protein [Pedobacter rhizosphaerae]SER32059.1 hypothetical protein SAMN04488023_10795 [Pedobacter rhizosphaerae]